MSQFKEGNIHQLANALENNGYTDEDVTKFRQGDLPGILAVLRGRAKIVLVEPEPLLEHVNSITNPGTIEKFIARGRFVINTKSGAPVKISYLGDNLKKWFLGKIEEPIGRSTLYYYNLLKASVDGPIIAKFGGKDKVAATLAEMLSYMEKQGNGEDGILLNNGYANIFYIPDISGVLRAVLCRWRGGGWRVGAGSVECPDGWGAGSRVFSRNRLVA